MKRFFRKLAVFFRKRWVWTLCIAIFLALLVWFLFPYIGFGESKPWESIIIRLISLCIIFLLWGLLLVFLNWRTTAVVKKKMTSEQVQEKLILEEKVYEERQTVTSLYKKAMQLLRKSSIYKGRSQGWKNDLPWYLIIGPESSGKTSILDFSGLNFPLNQIEQRLTKNIEGTRNCEWYFAEYGIIVDTSGRYFSQENTEVDSVGWLTLLNLLKHRKRSRPLNGVLVNIPIDDLLTQDEIALEQLARRTRIRLSEIHQKLGTECPVYILFSKADHIVGFNEFFDNLSQEESNQVLGVTFTKDQKVISADITRFEFERLLERLNKQVVNNLHYERDIQRRGKILDFPYQFNLLADQLCLFIELAIAGNRYQDASHLRGFYFMSAPHITEHLDQSTINIGRNLGLSSKALPIYREGKPRFIYQLFTSVIFPESELATLDEAEKSRISWYQRSLYIGAVTILAGVGLLWGYSFSTNNDYLKQTGELGESLIKQQKDLIPQGDLAQLQTVLNTGYNAVTVFPSDNNLAVLDQLGLYQGKEVTPTVRQTYHKELLGQMLPAVAKQLEDQIRANFGNRDNLLTNLRAYLMLNYVNYRDKNYLSTVMTDNWANIYPANTAVQNDLKDHFDRLLALDFIYPLNDDLVAQARRILSNEPIANLVYRAMKEQAKVLAPYTLSDHLGSQGYLITGANSQIPGFFTKQGYQQYFLLNGTKFITKTLKDNWVLGNANTLSPAELQKLMAQIEQLYFIDYTDQWSTVINKLRINNVTNFAESDTQLAGLTAANSPFLLLLGEIKEHTKLPGIIVESDDEGSTVLPNNKKINPNSSAKQIAKTAAKNTAIEGAKAGIKGAKKLAAASVPEAGKKRMVQVFTPYHRLLLDDGSPSPDYVNAAQSLNELNQRVAMLARDSAPEQAALVWAKDRMAGQQDALSSVQNSIKRLPSPFDKWYSQIADDNWQLILVSSYNYINQAYKANVYSFYTNSIKGRYPFNNRTDIDVAMSDFTRFFKVNGVMDNFYENNLKPFVSINGNYYQVKTIDGRGLPIARTTLAQFRILKVLQAGLFRENPEQPAVSFKLEPHFLEATLSRVILKIGNQKMEYRHGPILSSKFTWPDESADSSIVSEKFEDLTGNKTLYQTEPGAWSLFRFIDQMEISYMSGRDVMILKTQVDGKYANYLLSTQRSPNPFDVKLYRAFELRDNL